MALQNRSLCYSQSMAVVSRMLYGSMLVAHYGFSNGIISLKREPLQMQPRQMLRSLMCSENDYKSLLVSLMHFREETQSS